MALIESDMDDLKYEIEEEAHSAIRLASSPDRTRYTESETGS